MIQRDTSAMYIMSSSVLIDGAYTVSMIGYTPFAASAGMGMGPTSPSLSSSPAASVGGGASGISWSNSWVPLRARFPRTKASWSGSVVVDTRVQDRVLSQSGSIHDTRVQIDMSSISNITPCLSVLTFVNGRSLHS